MPFTARNKRTANDINVKGVKYSKVNVVIVVHNHDSPLWVFTCHMGSLSVTCHQAEVTFLQIPQPIKAGTRFSDPKKMQD